MKVTEDAANRVLRSKVLCVINLVGLFPPDGLQEYLAKEKNKIYTLGEVPHKWYWFWGWRYMHWWDGNPLVPRTHVFMRFIGEVITGASMPGKNRFVVDWRN